MYFSHLVILLCVLWNIYICSFEEFTRRKKTDDAKCFVENGCITAEFYSEDTCGDDLIPETVSCIAFKLNSTECLGDQPAEFFSRNRKNCELNVSLKEEGAFIGVLVHLQPADKPWLFLVNLSKGILTTEVQLIEQYNHISSRNGMKMFVSKSSVQNIETLQSRLPAHVFNKLLIKNQNHISKFKHPFQRWRSKRSTKSERHSVFNRRVPFIHSPPLVHSPKKTYKDKTDFSIDRNGLPLVSGIGSSLPLQRDNKYSVSTGLSNSSDALHGSKQVDALVDLQRGNKYKNKTDLRTSIDRLFALNKMRPFLSLESYNKYKSKTDLSKSTNMPAVSKEIGPSVRLQRGNKYKMKTGFSQNAERLSVSSEPGPLVPLENYNKHKAMASLSSSAKGLHFSNEVGPLMSLESYGKYKTKTGLRNGPEVDSTGLEDQRNLDIGDERLPDFSLMSLPAYNTLNAGMDLSYDSSLSHNSYGNSADELTLNLNKLAALDDEFVNDVNPTLDLEDSGKPISNRNIQGMESSFNKINKISALDNTDTFVLSGVDEGLTKSVERLMNSGSDSVDWKEPEKSQQNPDDRVKSILQNVSELLSNPGTSMSYSNISASKALLTATSAHPYNDSLNTKGASTVLSSEDIATDEVRKNWQDKIVKDMKNSVEDMKLTELKVVSAEEILLAALLGLEEKIQTLFQGTSPSNQQELLTEVASTVHAATFSAAKALVKEVCGQPMKQAMLVGAAWRPWGHWSPCSSSCGSFGFRLRHRTCREDQICTGANFDLTNCEALPPCEAYWLSWSDWQECSATCGTGIQYRFRACMAEDHDKACDGVFLDTQKCSLPSCPSTHIITGELPTPDDGLVESGQWTHWDTWSDCPVTCGIGKQVRDRLCMQLPQQSQMDKAPDENVCSGSTHEYRDCNVGPCTLPAAIRADLFNVKEGARVTLTCNYTEDLPVTEVYWITPQGQRIGRLSATERYHLQDSSLIISSAQLFDQGTYLCILIGPNGTTSELAADMAVQSCESDPCEHGGLCEEVVDMRFASGFHFRCICQPGYHGRYCQEKSVVAAHLPWLKVMGYGLLFLVLTLFFASLSMCVYYRVQNRKEKSLIHFQLAAETETFSDRGGHCRQNYPDSFAQGTDASLGRTSDVEYQDSSYAGPSSAQSILDDQEEQEMNTLTEPSVDGDQEQESAVESSEPGGESEGDASAGDVQHEDQNANTDEAESEDENENEDQLTNDLTEPSEAENSDQNENEMLMDDLTEPSEAENSDQNENENEMLVDDLTEPPDGENFLEEEILRESSEIQESRNANSRPTILYQDDIIDMVSYQDTTRLQELRNDISSYSPDEEQNFFLPRHSTPVQESKQSDYENMFHRSYQRFLPDRRHRGTVSKKKSTAPSLVHLAASSRNATCTAQKSEAEAHKLIPDSPRNALCTPKPQMFSYLGPIENLSEPSERQKQVHCKIPQFVNHSRTIALTGDLNNHGLGSEDGSSNSSESTGRSKGQTRASKASDSVSVNPGNLQTSAQQSDGDFKGGQSLEASPLDAKQTCSRRHGDDVGPAQKWTSRSSAGSLATLDESAMPTSSGSRAGKSTATLKSFMPRSYRSKAGKSVDRLDKSAMPTSSGSRVGKSLATLDKSAMPTSSGSRVGKSILTLDKSAMSTSGSRAGKSLATLDKTAMPTSGSRAGKSMDTLESAVPRSFRSRAEQSIAILDENAMPTSSGYRAGYTLATINEAAFPTSGYSAGTSKASDKESPRSSRYCAEMSLAARNESAMSPTYSTYSKSYREGHYFPQSLAMRAIFNKDDPNERYPPNNDGQVCTEDKPSVAQPDAAGQGGCRSVFRDLSLQKHLEGGGEGSSTSLRCDQPKSSREVLLRQALENSFVQSTITPNVGRPSQSLPRACQASTDPEAPGQVSEDCQATTHRQIKCDSQKLCQRQRSVQWKKQRSFTADTDIQHSSYFGSQQDQTRSSVCGRFEIVNEHTQFDDTPVSFASAQRGKNVEAGIKLHTHKITAKRWLLPCMESDGCHFEQSQNQTVDRQLISSPKNSDDVSDPVSSFCRTSSISARAITDRSVVDKTCAEQGSSEDGDIQWFCTSWIEHAETNKSAELASLDGSLDLSDSNYSEDSINQNSLLVSPLRSILKGSQSVTQQSVDVDYSTSQRRVSFREPEVVNVQYSLGDDELEDISYRHDDHLPAEKQFDQISCCPDRPNLGDSQFEGVSQIRPGQSLSPDHNMSQNCNSDKNLPVQSTMEDSCGTLMMSCQCEPSMQFNEVPTLMVEDPSHHSHKSEVKLPQEQELTDFEKFQTRYACQCLPKVGQSAQRYLESQHVFVFDCYQAASKSCHSKNSVQISGDPCTAQVSKHLHANTCYFQPHWASITPPPTSSALEKPLQNSTHQKHSYKSTDDSHSLLPVTQIRIPALGHCSKSAEAARQKDGGPKELFEHPFMTEHSRLSSSKKGYSFPQSQTSHLVSDNVWNPVKHTYVPFAQKGKMQPKSSRLAVIMSTGSHLHDEVQTVSVLKTSGIHEEPKLTDKQQSRRNSVKDTSEASASQGQSPAEVSVYRNFFGTCGQQHEGNTEPWVMGGQSTEIQLLTVPQAQDNSTSSHAHCDPDILQVPMQGQERRPQPSSMISVDSFQHLLSHARPNAFFKPIARQDENCKPHTG